MSDQKQSQFIEVQELKDSDYIPVFGQSSNRKISKPNLFDQIKDETQIFIYLTIERLQNADLAADPDFPIYVRVEETQYHLYKIVSVAPVVGDISLNNGLTAQVQEEYSETGFVLGPDLSTDGAIALFDGTTGTLLKNGPVATTTGLSFLTTPNSASTGYPKKNADNSVTMQTANQLKVDLSIDQVSNTVVAGKVNGPTSAFDSFVALFDGTTGKSIKVGDSIANYFSSYLADFLVSLYNIFPRKVSTFADLATTPATLGQMVETNGHTTAGIGQRRFISKTGVVAAGGDGGSKNASGTAGLFWEWSDLTTASIADFGANPANTSLTDAALTACQASTFKIFNVPPYVYTTTKSFNSLTKTYKGPGQITAGGGDALPGNYTYISTKPSSPGPAAPPYIFQGDLSKTTAEYCIIGSGLRTSLTEDYFIGQMSPRSQIFDNRSAESGLLCRLTANAAAGQPTIQVNSTQDVFNGQQLAISPQTVVGAYNDTLTVLSFVANTSITFTTNLLNSHLTGDAVSNGSRTNASWRICNVFHRGGGDCYSDVIRVEANFAKKPGQTHFYNTSTSGAFSGDTVASAPGNYLQMSEWQFSDNNNDVAVISEVRSFFRNNDTGAMGCIWNGTYYASGGNKAANSTHVVAGSWKRGLDLALADFSQGGQCAISLAKGQMIYWDNSGTQDVGLQRLWSNVLGTSKTYLDASNNYTYERGANKWIFTASGSTLLPGALSIGLDAAIPTNAKYILNSATPTTYLTYNGTNILLVKNGATVATW